MEVDKTSLRILKCLNNCESKTDEELISEFGESCKACISFLEREKYISCKENRHLTDDTWIITVTKIYQIDGYGKSYLENVPKSKMKF